MTKTGLILKDAFLLFAGSTTFVFVVNTGFSKLTKSASQETDPIVTAVVQNDALAVNRLLGDGKSADKSDDLGRTALMRVAYANYSDPKSIDDADTKRFPMVDALVQNGARIDAQDKDGWTPLMWASWSGLQKVAGVLLKAGAKSTTLDRQGNTALTIAAQRGNIEVVKILMVGGANPTVANRNGQTALDLARTGLAQYPAKKTAYLAIISELGPV